MSESKEYRRNAAERALVGGSLIGAGVGIKSHADKKYRVKGAQVRRNFTIIDGEGNSLGQHTVLEEKMVKPTFMHGVKNKSFTPKHFKYLGAKFGARAIQGAGVGLAVAGGKQFYKGQQNEKFSLKNEVVRPLVRADAIEAKVKERINKTDEEDKLIRTKQRTRRLAVIGGTIGGSALALRAPEFVGALKHHPKSNVLQKIKTYEPKATKASNSLLAVGSGVGAVGAFNAAHMQKLETNKLRRQRLENVQKAKKQSKDNKKLAIGAAAGMGAGLAFPTLQKTPHDNGASIKINADLKGSHTGHVNVSDLRSIARTPGKRYGEKQNQAKLTSKINQEGFKDTHPIEVSRFANGQMVVTNGHHRLKAAEDLGHSTVPIRVRNETAKAPRSFVPLYRSGRYVRDIVDARMPRKAMSEQELKSMENLAAKDLPKHIQHANKIKSVSEEIPHRLNTPKNKIGLAALGASGLGIYGTNKYHQNKVSKRDDVFLQNYRDRISPQAESGYKYLKTGARNHRIDAVAEGALGTGLIGYSIKDLRHKNKSGAAIGILGGAISLNSAQRHAKASQEWNAKMNKIKQRAYQRERDGEWGKGRNIDVAKSLWVQKGLSVGLPYPKGVLRRTGIRSGHLMRTASGKTVSVRGSVG